MIASLEEHFPEACTFRPRDISPDTNVFIDDEDMDKRGELIGGGAVEFTDGVEEMDLKDFPSVI